MNEQRPSLFRATRSHNDVLVDLASWTVPSLPTVSTARFLPLSPYPSVLALTKPLSIIVGPRPFWHPNHSEGTCVIRTKAFLLKQNKMSDNKENSSVKNEVLIRFIVFSYEITGALSLWPSFFLF